LGLHAEEIAEERPMGLNSEEGFTEVNEDGDMADRVGVEVLQLDPVVVEKTAEE
jgi:hypothetical protein